MTEQGRTFAFHSSAMDMPYKHTLLRGPKSGLEATNGLRLLKKR